MLEKDSHHFAHITNTTVCQLHLDGKQRIGVRLYHDISAQTSDIIQILELVSSASGSFVTQVLCDEIRYGVSVKRLEAGCDLPVESECVLVSHGIIMDDKAGILL